MAMKGKRAILTTPPGHTRRILLAALGVAAADVLRPRTAIATDAGAAQSGGREPIVLIVGDSLTEARLGELGREAYARFAHAAVTPLRQLDERHWLLELFHGPTLAFKDLAMQFLARLMDHALEQRGERVTIAVATSGDITWWGWTPDATNAEKLIAAFNEEYPDIEVTFVSKPIDSYDSVLGPAITSSDGPDVFGLAPGSANGGVEIFEAAAIDLRPAVEEALGADWADKLAPAGVEGLSVGDKLVALSAGAVYSGSIWLNQDIFDEYGLEAPTDMDSWLSVCDELEANGVGCFVQGAGQWAFDMDTFEAIMENVEPGAYVEASKGERPYTDDVFVQGMEIWKSLFDEGIMQEGAIGLQQYPDANNAFMSGQYAMVMMGSWYTQYAVRDSMVAAMEAAGVGSPEPITITPIQFPDLAGTGNTGSMFGDADYGVAVSAASDQQDAATTELKMSAQLVVPIDEPIALGGP